MNFHPRRLHLVKPRLQMRLSLVFSALAFLGLVLQAFLVHRSLSAAVGRVASAEELVRELPTQLMVSVVLASAALIPLTLLVGVLLTHRIAGPARRMEDYLRSWTTGQRDGPCQLRRRDALQDLCALLNDALEVADDEAGHEIEECDERSAA